MSDTIKLWIAACLAGILGALAMYAFHLGSYGIEWILTQHTGSLVENAKHLSPLLRIGVPTLGGVAAGLVIDWSKKWNTTPHIDYMDAARDGITTLNDKTNLTRILSSLCSVGSGASIGREGPMIQLSAWFASKLGKYIVLPQHFGNAALICGIAAGIAAAYHAPIAAVVFILELALGFFAKHTIAPLLISTVISSALIYWLVEPGPLYVIPDASGHTLNVYLLLAGLAMGVIWGIMGYWLLKFIEITKTSFSKITVMTIRLGAGGLFVGLISYYVPEVWGNGYHTVSTILQGGVVIEWVAIVLLAKVVATLVSTSSGAIGGIFTPTLFMGATSGYLMGGIVGVDPISTAIMGMAAMLAAVTHAPLMAIVMVLEMTNQFQLTLPVVLACAVAFALSAQFGVKPLYGNPIEHHN
ncbi:MAG: chloride channel protein [Betaproteobacteria bacterium]|nr:chloride channel protein [Betaproteobacteria bacterium]MDE2056451.1 chloride channel protein [Betaproteobacteria bacterium]